MTLSGPFAVEYRDTHTLRHSRPYKLLGDAIDREQIDRRKAALNGETTSIVRVLNDGTYAALETDAKTGNDQHIDKPAADKMDRLINSGNAKLNGPGAGASTPVRSRGLADQKGID